MRSSKSWKSLFLALPLLLLADGGRAQPAAPSYGGLEEGAASRAKAPSAPARNQADREAILFLANHVKALDASIAETRRLQAQVLEEARQREEEARRRAAEAERRRKQANSRAAGNALLLLSGADSRDVNTYNRIMDVHDVLAAKTPESRRDAQRQTVAPTALLLLGADVRTVNDLDTFSSAVGAMQQSSRARAMREQLARAKQGSQAAASQSLTLEESIKAMDAERTRAIDLLQGYSKRYLGEVGAIVAGIPGFAGSFGAVKDIAFDFSLAADSTAPLILALTFQIRGETVDVRLAEIDVFLKDRFESLLMSRQTARKSARTAMERQLSELDALVTQRASYDSQIRAKQAERTKLPGIRNWSARNKLDADIARIEKLKPTQAAEDAMRAENKTLEAALKKAEALFERARTARAMLETIDDAKAADALARVRALL